MKGNKERNSATTKAASKPKRDRTRYRSRVCKTVECTKFRQGKCNGYCMNCFYQYGATTCRDLYCVEKLHADGYCEFHYFGNVNDNAKKSAAGARPEAPLGHIFKAAAAKEETVVDSALDGIKKPAPPPVTAKEVAAECPTLMGVQCSLAEATAKSASQPEVTTAKKVAAPAAKQPSKQKKRKRERIRYTFPKTSTHKALRIEATTKNPKHQTITRDDLMSIFDSVLEETRHAKAPDGKTHYLLDEIRDNMKRALDTHKVEKMPSKKDAPNETQDMSDEPLTATSSIHEVEQKPMTDIIQGIPEESFSAEEIASMPVLFAYYCDDPESEQNAKIATLDYEVEQSRLKRQAVIDQSNTSSEQANRMETESLAELKSASTTEDKTNTDPSDADDFPPSGWRTEKVRRKKGTSSKPYFDTYYFSPKLGIKFRSKPEVQRFTALLDSSKGDEETAFAEMKRKR